MLHRTLCICIVYDSTDRGIVLQNSPHCPAGEDFGEKGGPDELSADEAIRQDECAAGEGFESQVGFHWIETIGVCESSAINMIVCQFSEEHRTTDKLLLNDCGKEITEADLSCAQFA
jgi:hypothetical protein